MRKINELELAIRDLRAAAATISDVADTLAEIFSTTTDEAHGAPSAEPTLTLEQIRAILADKSRMGYTAEIRPMLQKYGVSKLSAIDPANYKALVAEAEVLGNG